MKDLKYLELKRKGIIDKDDNVQLNGEQVPYYFLNEDCTAFNPPTVTCKGPETLGNFRSAA